MQDPTILIALLLVGVIAILFLSFYFSRRSRFLRALRKTPRSRIADVREGTLVKVQGRLEFAAQPLRAPLSGRSCAYYEAIVEERRKRGKSSYWREIIRETAAEEFLLRDESGEALIDLVADNVLLTLDAHYSSGMFDNAGPNEERFLSKHGHSSTGWIFNRTLRYREGVLAGGETVVVCGVARKDHNGRWVLRRAQGQPLMVTDDASACD
jgi:hypothetical protein